MTNPKFSGCDLLGDSMMLRFALHHADTIPLYDGYPTSWGMCHSDKTARELVLEPWINCSCNDQVIVMAGTHDLLYDCQDDVSLRMAKKFFKSNMLKIRTKAARRYSHVYFCTIPEIPSLKESTDEETRTRYDTLLPYINHCISAYGKNEYVTPIDLRGMFSRDCYVRRIGSEEAWGPEDNLLNFKGQAVLRGVLQANIRPRKITC